MFNTPCFLYLILDFFCNKCLGKQLHHCHIHLILRKEGDIANPAGGIRNIIPESK